MKKEILLRIKEKVNNLPQLPGVYKMLDELGNIIYVGKAKNLKNRVSSYFIATMKPEKVTQMVEKVYDFEYIVVNNELEALNLESNLIKKIQPFYNILLKDDKKFPYIKINLKEKFPKIEITRRILKDNALYFGPYFAKVPISDLVKIIETTFKLRNCNRNININSKNSRACLNYHLDKCMAPCINNVSHEDYMKEVNLVVNFLKGDIESVKESITKKMKKFVELQMFENSIQMRDNLKILDNISNRNIVGMKQSRNMDVFGLSTNGINSAISVIIIRAGVMIGLNNYNIIDASDNQIDVLENFICQYYLSNPIIPEEVVVDFKSETLFSWLKEKSKSTKLITSVKGLLSSLIKMAQDNAKIFIEKSIDKLKLNDEKTIGAINRLYKVLNLKQLPYRIEGYDISNLGGTNTVASMVVFINGVPYKSHYRKFKILETGQNDFLNMHNVLDRRLKELNSKDISFSSVPNLILIDGGAVQLEFANRALVENGFKCDIISLAKKEEEIYMSNVLDTIKLSKNDYALKLLQNVRDESHRFAISFQRNLRRDQLKSKLNDIKLLGENKIKMLYDHFKTISNIENATIVQLTAVPGIGKTLANNIYNYFHK